MGSDEVPEGPIIERFRARRVTSWVSSKRPDSRRPILGHHGEEAYWRACRSSSFRSGGLAARTSLPSTWATGRVFRSMPGIYRATLRRLEVGDDLAVTLHTRPEDEHFEPLGPSLEASRNPRADPYRVERCEIDQAVVEFDTA